MNRILVAGAAGFIGVNLINKLLDDENNLVFGVDNFSQSSVSALYSILRNPRFNFIQNDIKTSFDFSVDEIYYLIGSGDFSLYHDNKSEYLFDKINSLKSILEYAKLSGAKILFVSDFISHEERYNSLNTYMSYLQLAQDIIFHYSEENKVYSKIVQTTNLYGANIKKDDTRFIPDTIQKALNGEDIVLEYDEYNYFTYIEDFVNAIIKIMNSFSDKNIIDVSKKNLTTLSNVAKIIIELTASKSKIVLNSGFCYHQKIEPDFEYFEKTFGDLLTTSLEAGLKKTIDYYKLMYFS